MLPRLLPAVAAAAVLLVIVANADAVLGASFSESFLKPHNDARRAVGVRPLVWDERVAAYARRYAAQRSKDCALVHSHGPYGENLFRGSGAGWRPADVVGAWVREMGHYDYAQNRCRGGAACGHYKQIVWHKTTAVGCALVSCAGGLGTFGICCYNPAGNYVGMKPY